MAVEAGSVGKTGFPCFLIFGLLGFQLIHLRHAGVVFHWQLLPPSVVVFLDELISPSLEDRL